MPAGVQNFVSGRLTMAREARALRQKELAELVERSPATVSKWESEGADQAPEIVTLRRLAEVLRVDPDWFFKPLQPENGERAVFYRSLKGELDQLRAKARARLGFVEAIDEALSEYVDLPVLDVPDLLDGRSPFEVRREEIEGLADALRDHWDLDEGPIDDLLLHIENAGIVVAEDEIGSLKLDGVSRWSADPAGRAFMLLAKDKRVGVRRRFDAAHELAHVVLHRRLSQDELVEHFALIEEQAMAFAGALLLPSRHFNDDLLSLSLDAMLSIKEKWKVSVGAMIMRLSGLGKISHEYERRLWQYYSYRRWRTGEPLDDTLPVEAAHSLRLSIETIVDGRAASRADILKDVGLSGEDVCGLTGLPEGYFTPPARNVVRLAPMPRSAATGEMVKPRPGNVVDLQASRRSKA